MVSVTLLEFAALSPMRAFRNGCFAPDIGRASYITDVNIIQTQKKVCHTIKNYFNTYFSNLKCFEKTGYKQTNTFHNIF